MELLRPTTESGMEDVTGTGMTTDGGDVFTYVSGLTDLVRSADKAFAITYKKDMGPAVPFPETHSLILLAKDQGTFDVWSDGINFLLGNNLYCLLNDVNFGTNCYLHSTDYCQFNRKRAHQIDISK